MNTRAYVAEFLGTFTLAFGVSIAVARDFPLVPLVAALTLGVFVYTIGGISGAQLNPGVTFGLWSVKKMKAQDAISYIAVQLAAGFLALLAVWLFTGIKPMIDMSLAPAVALGEVLGAFLLSFGVSSVVWGKVNSSDAGMTVGGSLLMGILLASAFSKGILNPAVAVSLGAFSPFYLLAPIVGGILGAQAYQWLQTK
jgi:glycerol uptake facilitator-like aquaporin